MQAKIKKGFTLIEILLVITLLAILMGIVVLAINPRNLISEVNDNKREADAMTIYQALEQYALKNSAYPSAIVNIPNNSSAYICKTTATNCTNAFQINLSTNILVPTYMSKIPEYSTDANNSGFYVVKDSNGKIGIGGVKQVNSTTFVKGLESQSFSTVPTSPIVTNGLVLNLDAGNPTSYPGTGTTWFDLSGGNNSGTLVNGVGYNSTNGGSLAFDGSNDYVLLTQTLTTPFTITGFIRYTDQAKTLNTFINTNPHAVLGISLNRLGGGQLYVYIGNGSGWQGVPGIISSQNMNVNQWYQVSFTSTGSGSILYLNGVNVGTSIYSPSGWGSSYYLGTIIIASGEYLKGNIGTTQIYNRALTASEIEQNFNALKGRYGL